MMRTRFLIGLLPAVLILSACQKTDTDLVLDFVNSWLESRGAVAKNADGSYSPTLKGAGVAMGFATTGDDTADAALQAGKVAKDIADSDKLVKQADADMDKDPRDVKAAEAKLNTAVSTRPDDWYYRNHRAYLYLDTGNGSKAKRDLQAGVEGCDGNQNCLNALHRDRINFYSGYQITSFVSADPRMRSNCEVHTMGVQSFEALIPVSTGQLKTDYESALATARQQRDESC